MRSESPKSSKSSEPGQATEAAAMASPSGGHSATWPDLERATDAKGASPRASPGSPKWSLPLAQRHSQQDGGAQQPHGGDSQECKTDSEDLPEEMAAQVISPKSQVSHQLGDVHAYLQDVDMRLQDQIGRLMETVNLVHSRLESMCRTSIAARAGRHGTGSPSEHSVTPGLSPLIGRPAENPQRQASRNGTGSSCNTHSLLAAQSHMQQVYENVDLSHLQRRPSNASSHTAAAAMAAGSKRRPSNAGHTLAQLHNRTPAGNSIEAKGVLASTAPMKPNDILSLHRATDYLQQKRRPSNASLIGMPPNAANLAARRPSIGSDVSCCSVDESGRRKLPPMLPGIRRPSTCNAVQEKEVDTRGDDDTESQSPRMEVDSKANSVISDGADSEPPPPLSCHSGGTEDDAEVFFPSEMSHRKAAESKDTTGRPPFSQWSLCPGSACTDDLGRDPMRVKATRLSSVRSLTLDFSDPPEDHGRCRISRCILLPGSQYRLMWDSLMVVATALATTLMPLSLMYWTTESVDGDRADILSSGLVAVVLHTVDVLWVLDVVVNLRTGHTSQGRLVRSPRLIFMNYARTWLVMDLATAWPAIFVPRHALVGLRIVKLLRLVHLTYAIEKLCGELRSLPLMVLKVALMIFLPVHVLACAWRATRSSSSLSAAALLSTCGGKDLSTAPEACMPTWQRYMQDAYWVVMTLTTVGFGDIHPDGADGRVLSICVMLMAPFFNGTIVSFLTHFSRRLFNDEVQREVSEAMRFLRRRDVPSELRRRVEHCLRCRLRQETQLAVLPTLMQKLSPSMQRELTLDLLSSTVLNFRLFKGASVAFIAEIAQAHTWVQCIVGDLIVEEGQLEQELVFVVLGRLLLLNPVDHREGHPGRGYGGGTPHKAQAGWVSGVDDEQEQEFVEQEICVGGWFGEASLFNLQQVRTHTVFARIDSELAALPASSYHDIVSRYPQVQRGHNAIERDIHSGRLSLEDLAYKVPSHDLPRKRPAAVGKGKKVFDTAALDQVSF